LVCVTVARDQVREVRVGGREEGGDSGRRIPLAISTSEDRLAKNLLRSNPIFFEGVAEHGNVGIDTLVLVFVVLRTFGGEVRSGPRGVPNAVGLLGSYRSLSFRRRNWRAQTV
jgi:hypothetical protein